MVRLPVFSVSLRAATIALALAAAINVAAPLGASSGADCQFVLGFRDLRDLDPGDVGNCLANQTFAPNGDATQPTTNGLLVWRKADNFTAFTDGYHTWVNGPYGVQERLNGERFPWEASAGNAAPLPGFAAPRQPGDELDGLSTDFYNALNTDRKVAGLQPLVLNSQLSTLAESRAQGLVPKGGALSHYDTNGNLVLKEIMDDNHIPFITAGENLAENNYDPSRTVEVANTGLMNSPTHRGNILNPNYNQVGIGLAGPDGGGRFYYVQLFLQT